MDLSSCRRVGESLFWQASVLLIPLRNFPHHRGTRRESIAPHETYAVLGRGLRRLWFIRTVFLSRIEVQTPLVLLVVRVCLFPSQIPRIRGAVQAPFKNSAALPHNHPPYYIHLAMIGCVKQKVL